MPNTKRKTEQEYHDLAAKRGGKCIFIGKNTRDNKTKWMCAKEHVFYADYSHVLQRRWCPICSDNHKKPQDYRDLAAKKGGKCLRAGKNSGDKMAKWQCSHGHVWCTCWDSILNDNWCPFCVGLNHKTQKDYDAAAKKNNGICLLIGKNALDRKAKWQCKEGHQWNACISAITNTGSWCPECSSGKSEKLVRSLIEKLTGKVFTRCRPDFLKQINGYKLELDGFNNKTKTSFEYQGAQHYKPVRFYGETQKQAELRFKSQKKRDRTKRKLCKAAGVKLIEIPYTVKITEENIRNILIENGVELKHKR